MDYLFEALPPMQAKRVAFAIGRFNPPTEGHYRVINKLKEFIRKNPELNLEASPVIVVVTGEKSSLDKTKNPLSADDRISFMKASGRANGVIFLTAKNGSIALGIMRDNGYEPIAIGAGSDRAQGYLTLLKKSFFKPNGSELDHTIVPGLARSDDAVATKKSDKETALNLTLDKMKAEHELSPEDISSSLARRAVELGYLEEFTQIVGLQNKPKLAKLMFDKIKKAIGGQIDG
jgi:hypothetical protein